MASSGYEEKKLSDIYKEGFALYEALEFCDKPTNCSSVQFQIKQAMKSFEDATRLVSMAGLFSSNESVEEVTTKDLQYFLLPALLGKLVLKLCVSERMEIVQTAEIYFRDFLQRCYDYGITTVEAPPVKEEDDAAECEVAHQQESTGVSLVDGMRKRTAKLQRYTKQKALEKELADLKKALSTQTVDDELERKYYLALIDSYISSALDELDALQSEKEILKYLSKMKKEETLGLSEDKKRLSKQHPKPKPLMPIIITRDDAQKKVFGAGYPSLPTMTVKEFYDKRVMDGVFPDAATIKTRSLMDIAVQQNARELAEKEDEEKELKVANDDEETLRRAREWDEHKDSHRRGEGNRYNRS